MYVQVNSCGGGTTCVTLFDKNAYIISRSWHVLV